MKAKPETTERKPRQSAKNFTEPQRRLSDLFVSERVANALDAEAERQGVTLSVVRRQALDRLIDWIEGDAK